MRLTAKDALSDQVICISAASRPTDLSQFGETDSVYAVFSSDAYPPNPEEYLGLVTHDQATRRAQGRFGDLVTTKQYTAVSDDTDLDDVVWRFNDEGTVVIPVFDERGCFVGVITRASLMMFLLRYSRDMSESVRQFRKTLQDTKRRRAEWSKRLDQLTRAFRKLMSLLARPASPDLFQRGIEALAVLLEADYAAVALIDDHGQLRESIFTGTTPGGSNDIKTFLKHRRPLVDSVVQKVAPMNVPDVPRHLSDMKFPIGHPTLRTFLGVPITREDHTYGCVYLCNKNGREAFTEDDDMLATSFAQTVGLVLAQARERVERRLVEQERELLGRLGIELAAADTLEKLGAVVAALTYEFWNWSYFALSVRRAGRDRFVFVTRTEVVDGERRPVEGGEYQALEQPFGERLLRGETVLIACSQTPGNAELPDAEEQPDTGACQMHAPIRLEGEIGGILSIEAGEGCVLSERDRAFLQRLIDAIGPALARCQAEKRSALFSLLAFSLSTATGPTEAARTIVDTAEELVGWDSCSVYLYDAEAGTGKSVLHLDEVAGKRIAVHHLERLNTPGPVALRTMAEGPQLILRDREEWTHGLLPFGDHTRPSMSLMFVPLRLGRSVIGIMSLQSYARNAYNERDLQLLQTLADHCAGALERARAEEALRTSQADQSASKS